MKIEPSKLARFTHYSIFATPVWVILFLCALLSGFAQNVYADPPTLFAGEAGDLGVNFFTIDPATGDTLTFTDIDASLTGLAVHPRTRVIYGAIAGSSVGTLPNHSLVTIDRNTLQLTLIGEFLIGIGDPLGDITFDPDTSILYGWSGGSAGAGDLYTVNLTTGAATKVGESGLSFNGGGYGLTFVGGNLYLAGDGDCGELYTINPATGLSTGFIFLDGAIEPCLNINALASDGSTVFGSNKQGDLIIIDPVPDSMTGLATITFVGTPLIGGFSTFISALAFDLHADLTLQNSVTNDDTGTSPDTAWTLSAIGVTPGLATSSGAEGDATITDARVGRGTFLLDAGSGPQGYLQGDWSCTGGTLVGNQLTLDFEETAVCTIVHDDIPAFDIDLSITNLSSADPVAPGQVFTYTVTVANSGPGDAMNARVENFFPPGLINVTWSCEPGAGSSCGASGSGDIDELVNIAAGGDVVYTVSAEVVPNPPPSIESTSVVTSPTHRVVMADGFNSRVQTCDYLGNCTGFGTLGGLPGQFGCPRGVLIDPAERLVITDACNDNLQICDETGTNCTIVGSSGTALGQFDGPMALAQLSDGRFVIADHFNSRVVICTDTGTCTALGTGVQGNQLGEFTFPAGVAVNSLDEIIVSDRGNARVQICDTGGTCTAFGGFGSALGQFSNASGVTVDSFDRIIVADTGNDRIQICDNAGLCTAFGTIGTLSGEFEDPFEVSVNLFGSIVISDGTNDRIQECNYDGSSCSEFGSTGTAFGQFNLPWGVDTPLNGRNDTNGGNNLVSVSLAVVADVEVTKTTNVTEYLPGGPTINYTIDIVNNGPGDATSVSVVDDIPAGIVSASWTCTPSAGANCNASGFGSIDEIVDLPSGESVTYEYLADPAVGATGNITNTVTIDAGAVDTNAANDVSTVVLTEGVPQATTINVSPGLATTIELDGLCSLTEAFLAADDPGAPTGPGECPVGDGVGPVTINLAPGSTYTFDSAVYVCCGESPAFLPSVQVPLTLNGNGATIAAGAAAGSAAMYGAINDFSVNNVTVTGIQDSPVIDFDASNGLLTVSQVTFDNSFGGVYLFAGTADIDESLFVGRGPVLGYGVFLTDGGIATITNSTITNTNNGINSFGSVTIENSTLSGNEIALNSNRPAPQREQTENDLAHSSGRQARQLSQREVLPGLLPPGTLEIANSIVANSQEVNCLISFGATIASNDFNIDDGSSCGFSLTNDLSFTDPLLGLLADNGGPTFTFEPLFGSPAIDGAGLSNPNCPAIDQRGISRPQDGNGLFDAECDIGAVEIQLTDIELVINKITSNEATAYLPGSSLKYVLLVDNFGPSAVTGGLVTDNLPAGLTNVSWTCEPGPGANCNASGLGNISELVDIPANSWTDFTISVDVLPTTTGDLTNTATISDSSGLTETDPLDNTSTLVLAEAVPVVINVDPTVVDIDYEDGLCSLIEAFDAVDGSQAPDSPGECPLGDGVAPATINLAPGSTYTFINADFFCCAEDGLFLPSLFIDTTINGNGATITTGVDADNAIFINSEADLAINDLTIQGATFEAAIYYRSEFGTLTLGRVALLDNFGGVRLREGSAVIVQSFIDGQLEDGYGVDVGFDTNLDLLHSTITGANVAIENSGTTNVINSTLNGNGEGVTIFSGSVTVQNSIVANSVNQDCSFGESGDIFSADFNIATDASCNFSGNNDLNSTNPLLGPLADNGGPTLSFAPLPGSPAIDRLDVGNPSCPLADQRGITRPQDGNGDLVSSCDVGSVEVFLPDIDLQISKDSNFTTVFPGDIVSFTLSVFNNGPAAASNAQVIDNVNGIGFDQVSWTCTPSAGASCTAELNGSINDTVQIPAGGSLSYAATALVGNPPGGFINNTAEVIADPGLVELNPANNSDSLSIEVLNPNTFDLQISKTDGLATAGPGEQISYTITVFNAGTTVIAGATVEDILPTELENATWSCAPSAGGSCTQTGVGNISDVVTISSDGQLVYTLTATVNDVFTGTLMNTATVSMPNETVDESPENNTATDATEIVAMADLSVVKTTTTQSVLTDESVEFQVTVTNNGPETATEAILDDMWTAELTLVDVQPAEIDCGADIPSAQMTAAGGSTKLPKPRPFASAANMLQCNLGNLASGASIVFTMTFEVSGETNSVASNSAVVSSAIPDPNDGNNGSTAMIDIVEVLSLTPVETELPSAAADQPYTQAFEVTGGVEPITINAIGEVDGLTWSMTGRTATLSGTPLRAGIHSISVDATDSLAFPTPQTVMREYALQVTTELVIAPETLPAGTVGLPYTVVLESLNGVPPFVFGHDSLPAGLSVNGDTIEGVPQTEGVFAVILEVADSQDNEGERNYDLQINLTPEIDQVLPDGVLETGYSAQLFGTTANGPLNWAVDSGLPPGLTLQPTGFIGGVPTQEGSFAFTATATDTLNNQTTGQLNIDIGTTGLLAQETVFPNGAVGFRYTAPTGIDGGVPPYFCAPGGSGRLPPGLILNGCNIGIDGIPRDPGTFRFTLNITDSALEPNDLTLSGRIQIVAGPQIPDPDPPNINLPNPRHVREVDTGTPVPPEFPSQFPDEALQKLVIDDFGNRYTAGFSYNGTDYDIRILKYTAQGELVWDQRYDSGDHDYGYAITVNPVDQSLYVGGYQLDGTEYKAVLLRFDLAGILQFVAQNPGGSLAKGYYDLAANADGVFAVGEAYNGTNFDGIVAFHAHDGTLMWETTRAANDTESAYAIELNACDGCPVVVAGVTGIDRGNGWVDALDPVTGTLSSLATVSGFGVLDIAPGNDGIVIGGSTPSNDWTIATLGAGGAELWRTAVPAGDRLRSIATDRSGYIHAVGNGPGTSGTDALIALLSPAGALLGSQAFDAGASEELNGVAIGPEGLVTAAGQSRQPAVNNNTFLLLNFDTGKSFLLGPVQ